MRSQPHLLHSISQLYDTLAAKVSTIEHELRTANEAGSGMLRTPDENEHVARGSSQAIRSDQMAFTEHHEPRPKVAPRAQGNMSANNYACV